MSALNPRQRAVVDYILTVGTDNWTAACIAAGYENTEGAIRVQAHRLRHDPKISAAITEEGSRRVAHDVPAALAARRRIMESDQHKDQLKAASQILEQVGMGAVNRSQVNVIHSLDGDLMDRARAAASRLGLDLTKMIDLKPIEVHVETEEEASIRKTLEEF